MFELEVKTLVVSLYAIVLSDVAATVNETASPAATDPKDPAAVEKLGAVDAVNIAVDFFLHYHLDFLLLHSSYQKLKLH